MEKYHVINKDKIYEAFIIEPYKSEDAPWETQTSHGWQVCLILGYSEYGPIRQEINRESFKECKEMIDALGFFNI